MRRFLLDTSLLTAYLLKRQTALRLIRSWMKRHEAVTSIVVYGEVYEYIQERFDYKDLKIRLEDAIGEVKPLSLTTSIMQRYAAIRKNLRPKGKMIGDIDTIIAATALERNLTIVTTDEDFKRVPDLKLMLIPRSKLKRHKVQLYGNV